MKAKAMIMKKDGKVVWRDFNDDGVAYLDPKKEDDSYVLEDGKPTHTARKWGLDYQVAVFYQGNPESLPYRHPEGLTSKHLATLLGPKLSRAMMSALHPTLETSKPLPKWLWWVGGVGIMVLIYLWKKGLLI